MQVGRASRCWFYESRTQKKDLGWTSSPSGHIHKSHCRWTVSSVGRDSALLTAGIQEIVK